MERDTALVHVIDLGPGRGMLPAIRRRSALIGLGRQLHAARRTIDGGEAVEAVHVNEAVALATEVPDEVGISLS